MHLIGSLQALSGNNYNHHSHFQIKILRLQNKFKVT